MSTDSSDSSLNHVNESVNDEIDYEENVINEAIEIEEATEVEEVEKEDSVAEGTVENVVDKDYATATDASNMSLGDVAKSGEIYIGLSYAKRMSYLPLALDQKEEVADGNEVILAFFEFLNDSGKAESISPMDVSCYADGVIVEDVETYIKVKCDGIGQFYNEELAGNKKAISVQDFEVPKGWEELKFFYKSKCVWVLHARYEELLIRRDNIKKQAFQWEREYIRVFGDKILKIFELKVTCIRKKKTITYCQAILNHGGVVNQEELSAYLAEQMADYEEQLEAMIQDNDASKQTGEVSEIDALNIKKIYRRLAKILHPDINPLTNENEGLMDLWQRIIIAYNCNNLKELTEVEVLVTAALERLNSGTIEVEIPNIEEKIIELEEEILKIRESDPYLYKDILTNKDKVAEKNAALEEEYNSYIEYEKQLDFIIDGLISNGVKIIWRMN